MFQKAKPVIFILCLGLAVSGCDQQTDSLNSQNLIRPNSKSNLLVNVMRVKEDLNATETSVFFGTLKPNRQSQLRFGQAGRIKRLLKNVGQSLTAGERFAELELEQLEQQRLSVETAIRESEQNPQRNLRDVDQLRSQLKTIEAELEKGYILAPYDCVVASKTAVAGDLVSPQSPIATVYETKPVFVEANLPLRIVQRLPFEQTVWVAVGDEAVRAVVKTKSPQESTVGSRLVRFEVTAPNADNWSFGQTVKIRFLTSTNKTGYWLPVSALSRESTGLWSALTVTPDPNSATSEVQRKILELVQLEDEWALTQGAFKENEFVIVNGAHRVVPGQLVTATDVTAQVAKRNTGAPE